MLAQTYSGEVAVDELTPVNDLRGPYAWLVELARAKITHPREDLVVNLSWGRDSADPVEGQAISKLADAGVVFVAAAGNDGAPILKYPAAYAAVMSVGAVVQTGSALRLADYSNFGPGLSFCAVDDYTQSLQSSVFELEKLVRVDACEARILTADVGVRTLDEFEGVLNRYAQRRASRIGHEAGTSFAAPIVAASLAQGLQACRSCTVGQIVRALRQQAARTSEGPACAVVRHTENRALPATFYGALDPRAQDACDDLLLALEQAETP